MLRTKLTENCEGIYFIGEKEIKQVESARALCSQIRSLQEEPGIPQPLPPIRNYKSQFLPNKDQFNVVLSAYEVLQDYHLRHYKQGDETAKKAALQSLIELEDNFTQQVEPCPVHSLNLKSNVLLSPKNKDEIKEWKEREKDKFERGISPYCNPEIQLLLVGHRLSTDQSYAIKRFNWEKISALPY